jgi:hypothetical protein
VLAYELYLRNKDSKANVVKLQKPIKKIFVNKGKITIDTKTVEEYGSETIEKYRILQESMTMPLNTSNRTLLNLPDSRTSSSQPNPYVEIYGTLKVTNMKPTLSLQITGRNRTDGQKRDELKASYNLSEDKVQIQARKGIQLKLESKNYFISGKSLYDGYVESDIIKKDGYFSPNLFLDIANEFFRYAKKIPIKPERNIFLPFSVYILPSSSPIQVAHTPKNTSNVFTDAFGNLVTSFASGTTKNAKFLSFDDKAFTINCKKEEDFYENVGIGAESLQGISLPADQVFKIAGLSWMFTNLDNPDYKFKETNRGIFNQLYENYEQINSSGQSRAEKVMLKVTCFRTQQAKLEILIDENMTMDRMKRLFSWCDVKSIPVLAFEELIERMDKKVLWNNYIYAIRSFISELSVPRSFLIPLFEKIMRRRIHQWLKQETQESINFFKRTNFCLKTLSSRHHTSIDTNPSENFAYQVGKIAKSYIEFKKRIGDKSNSLRDILTYSKYDRDTLRFVFRRIGTGVNISKANENDMQLISNKISKYQPEHEISDSDAYNDYSYFFYKGYFGGEDK